VVEADSGAIGGSFSHEFMVIAETGEDAVACCDRCDYAANTERAEIRRGEAEQTNVPRESLNDVETPGQKSVEDVARFLKTNPACLIKTLIVSDGEGQAAAALVRGDHELNEIKLKNRLGWSAIDLADEETVRKVTGGPSGFSGPVGLHGVPLIADYAVESMRNAVTGANRLDRHFRNVNPGRDFTPDFYADIRAVREGDGCPRCRGLLRIIRGIEVGHIFKLGTKYSEAMGAVFLDEQGKSRPMIMGCYGIGVGRTAAAAIEQNHDADGIRWPLPLAPFSVLVLPLNVRSGEVISLAETIHAGLTGQGIDTLLDDRNERPGSKFKDADLIGIPYRVVVGDRGLKEGVVEIKERKSGAVTKVPVEEAVSKIVSLARD